MAGDYSIGGLIWPGLAKVLEEVGEVGQVLAKIMGGGGATQHWDGKGDLKVRLEEELGDLLAAVNFLITQNDLDQIRIDRQRAGKAAQFLVWHQAESKTRERVYLDHPLEVAGHRWIIPHYRVVILQDGTEGIPRSYLHGIFDNIARQIVALPGKLTAAETQFLLDHLKYTAPKIQDPYNDWSSLETAGVRRPVRHVSIGPKTTKMEFAELLASQPFEPIQVLRSA
jgi:NTP pyrophosphatase (non-canonical NTP hydrolase)